MPCWSRFIGSLVAAVIIVSALVGCRSVVGPLHVESQKVELGGAESVEAEIIMGAGSLRIEEGASDLLDANFRYNIDSWAPRIDYTVRRGRGNLIVSQPNSNRISLAQRVRYDWHLRFNENVPLNLNVTLGAGEANLSLSHMALETLKVEMGAGEVRLDLSGDWQRDVDIRVHGGIGSATIILPKDVGVRVEAHGGLGEIHARGLQKRGDAYINQAYSRADVTLDIQVEAGIGELNLEVAE